MCKSFPAGFAERQIRLQLRPRLPDAAATSPCELPAEGGYRSLENHLYRVEIHRGGVQGTKPDLREVVARQRHPPHPLLDVADGSLVVEEIGKDDVTALATDDWVELRDEGRILRGEPGFFVEIARCGHALGIRTILDPLTLAPLTQGGNPTRPFCPNRASSTGGRRCARGTAAGAGSRIENGVIIASRTVRILPPP